MKREKVLRQVQARTPENVSQTGSVTLNGTDIDAHIKIILEKAREYAKSAARYEEVNVTVDRWPSGVDPQQVVHGVLVQAKDYGLMFRVAFDTKFSFKLIN